MSPRSKRNPYDPPRRAGRILLCTAASLLAVLLAAVLISVLLSRSRGEPPSVFGYSVYIVTGDSMEATMSAGDALLVRRTDPAELQAGDVITFSLGKDAQGRELVDTRRIVEVCPGETALSFRTQGDNLPEPDPELCPADQVLGRGISSMPGLGKFFAFVKTPLGLVCCIALPLGILLVFEVISLLRVSRRDREQEEEAEEVSPLAMAVKLRQQSRQAAARPLEYAFPEAAQPEINQTETERIPIEPLHIPLERPEPPRAPEPLPFEKPEPAPEPKIRSTLEFAPPQTVPPPPAVPAPSPPDPPAVPEPGAEPAAPFRASVGGGKDRFRIEGIDVCVKPDSLSLALEEGSREISITVTQDRTSVSVGPEGRAVCFSMLREGEEQKVVIRRQGAQPEKR